MGNTSKNNSSILKYIDFFPIVKFAIQLISSERFEDIKLRIFYSYQRMCIIIISLLYNIFCYADNQNYPNNPDFLSQDQLTAIYFTSFEMKFSFGLILFLLLLLISYFLLYLNIENIKSIRYYFSSILRKFYWQAKHVHGDWIRVQLAKIFLHKVTRKNVNFSIVSICCRRKYETHFSY